MSLNPLKVLRSRKAWLGSAGLTTLILVLLAAMQISTVFAAPAFSENFAGATSPYFNFLTGSGTIASNVADAAASDGKAAKLTLPAWPGAGPGSAPNLQSGVLYGFGTFEARFKTPDCSSQPNTGLISGFFTYVNDGTDQDSNGTKDNSEIDFEILCAEPNVLWLTQWTDFQESPLAMKRIYRELDLATGTIRRTCYSEGYGTCTQDLTGSATEGQPSSIAAIPGFNSATSYYTYGWTWASNRMTWYIYHPTTGQKIILWDYQGPTARITQRQAYYMFNVWHTNNWPPPSMPNAIEAPTTPRTLSIDWATYGIGAPLPTNTACAGCPTATKTLTPSPAPSCYADWVSNITYPTGSRVTYQGNNYQANYATNGDNPALHSGPAGSGQPWLTLGACTGGTTAPTATPTRTNTTAPATLTPTRTNTASGPTVTLTRTNTAGPATLTPTRTNTSSGPTVTFTRTPTASNTPIPPTPTATSAGGGGCYTAWVSNITYPTGSLVTYNGINYQANYPTNGDNPALHSGPAGSGQPWLTLGACNPATATKTNTPLPTYTPCPSCPTPTQPAEPILWDDFSYSSASDPLITQRNWILRSVTGGPGVAGASWANNVTFVTDPANSNNKLMQLNASTDGTAANTKHAEMYHQRKFFEGTYAARVYFTDAPETGPDGENIVETFFTITPLAADMDPNYGELDFEYLPNGGWGAQGPIMYLTSWETYQNVPWNAVNTNNNYTQSYAGWHTLVLQVSGGQMKYYIDGTQVANHGGIYYPETPMSINFNLWFITLQGGSTLRQYKENVDWVFYNAGQVLTQAQIDAKIATYRASNVKHIDTVPDSGLPGIPNQ